MYGDQKVIDSLAEFWSQGAGFATVENQDAFVNLIQNIGYAIDCRVLAPQKIKEILLDSPDEIQARIINV